MSAMEDADIVMSMDADDAEEVAGGVGVEEVVCNNVEEVDVDMSGGDKKVEEGAASTKVVTSGFLMTLSDTFKEVNQQCLGMSLLPLFLFLLPLGSCAYVLLVCLSACLLVKQTPSGACSKMTSQ